MISMCTLLFNEHEGSIVLSSHERDYISIQKLINLNSLTKISVSPLKPCIEGILNMHIRVNHVINKRGDCTKSLVHGGKRYCKIYHDVQVM